MHAPVDLKRSTINTEALNKLADLLEADAVTGRFKFNLSYFLRTNPGCRTAGCAIGLAMTNEWFQKRGFRAKNSLPVYEPPGERYAHWDAVKKFFGISYVQAVYLFHPTRYSNKVGQLAELEVAARLREFVADPFYRADETEYELVVASRLRTMPVST